MAKENEVMFYRVTVAVTAENLPEFQQRTAAIASLVDIAHWYDEVLNEADQPQDHVDQAIDRATGAAQAPSGKIEKVMGGETLVAQVLHHAHRAGGVTRKQLKIIAEQYGFNVGSVSPTLVKLMAAKKLKRIGKGVYAARKTQR